MSFMTTDVYLIARDERIKQLETENERLREDNSALRSALRRLATDAMATANALSPEPQTAPRSDSA